MQQVWWNNTVEHYLLVLGVILFVVALNRFISRYFAGLLFRIVHRVWKDVDKKAFINLVVQPLGIFLVVVVSIVSLHKLHFPAPLQVEIYRFTVREIFQATGISVLIIAFVWLLLRIIDFIAIVLEKRADMTDDQADNQLIIFFKDFFKVFIVIIGILLVLHFAFDLNIGSLLTGLSIVGAAIALALRESIENLIASFIIFFDKPFTAGDIVKVLNITGAVEKIGLRSTRIRTDQKTYVTVPNKQMVDSVLDNLSLRTQRRGELELEIGLRTTSTDLESFIDQSRKLLKRAEIENSSVYMHDITGQAFIVQVQYFTAPITLDSFNVVKQELNLGILKLLETMKIEIAGANTEVQIVQSK